MFTLFTICFFDIQPKYESVIIALFNVFVVCLLACCANFSITLVSLLCALLVDALKLKCDCFDTVAFGRVKRQNVGAAENEQCR